MTKEKKKKALLKDFLCSGFGSLDSVSKLLGNSMLEDLLSLNSKFLDVILCSFGWEKNTYIYIYIYMYIHMCMLLIKLLFVRMEQEIPECQYRS